MAKKGVTGLLACLALSLGLIQGCVDPEEEGGNTSGTTLYVFDTSDSASSRVLVYSDLSALFDDNTIEPSRRLSGSKIDTVRNLAWGGMCFDANGNRLYMVSETGDVVRVERARSASGNISNPIDIASFRLGGSGERLSDGKFGQASIDTRENILYVTESNSSDTRIWVVRNPGSITDGTSVSNSNLLSIPDGDRGGTGVAAHSGFVYAYFDDGSYINNPLSGVSYSGSRLRRGSSTGFARETSLVIGDASDSVNRTQLAKYGSLAIDQDGQVYFARHLSDAAVSSGNAILFFRPGQFSPGLNQAPERTFASISNLRIISHAVTRDWLVGALSAEDWGSGTIWIWKSPSSASSASSVLFSVGSNVTIRGLALDGSN